MSETSAPRLGPRFEEALGYAAELHRTQTRKASKVPYIGHLLSVAGLVFALGYPHLKRVTHLPQFGLGVAFSWGIPMAFAAERGELPAVLWPLFVAAALWSVVYDTFYAMVDRDDDLKIGIRTAAITFGRHDVAAVMICYAITLALLALAGRIEDLGWPYYAGLAGAAAIAVYHFGLIRDRSRAGCFRAFNHNNWFGAAVFAGVAAGVLAGG